MAPAERRAAERAAFGFERFKVEAGELVEGDERQPV
jgi:hypothetical protein